MAPIAVAAVLSLGVYYVYTAVVLHWSGIAIGPASRTGAVRRSVGHRRRASEWLVQAGGDDVSVAEFATVSATIAVFGSALGFLLFGGVVAPIVVGSFAGSLPWATYRQRRVRRNQQAQEAWPRMIEEIRILTGSVGRSIPQALFEVGRNGPTELRSSFAAAHREWLLSTDFARTLDVLKARLADTTCDATCETLLIAHELGGSDLDQRLEALAEDRRRDTHDRKDAHARQAGARFSRRFVLIVPLGMAVAGMSIGNGRAAYQTPSGQMIVLVALALVGLCWFWAGRIMRLPVEDRVFD